MALTLTEAAKYSNDVLQTGVIELLVKDDPILEKLQFKDIKGNGLTYDVETTMSGADFYSPNDTWSESTSVVTQHTAVTTILGGDADVDNFLKATRSNLQDLMGEQIKAKVKAIKDKFMTMFYYGWNGSTPIDTKGFTGLHGLIYYDETTYPNYPNTIAVGSATSTPVALGLESVEAAIDMVKTGKPEMVLMSKMMRRYINVKLQSVGGLTYTDAQKGRVQQLFEVPVYTTDYIKNTEEITKEYVSGEWGFDYTDGTAYTADDSTSIFVLQFAPEAVCGIQSAPITVEKLGSLETKDATRVRIKWYPSVMLQNVVSVAKITGIDPNGTVTYTQA